MIPTLRLYRAQGEDRVAVLSTEPAHQAGSWLVRVARGKKGTSYGPFAAEALQARFDDLAAALKAEGFQRSGVADAIARLSQPDRRKRALAASRLGRLRAGEAVPALLAALENATDEACSIVDALGAIGDPGAIHVARAYASRKLLSRRRSGVEALRNLGDTDGLTRARLRAIERLEEPVRQALAAPALDLTPAGEAATFAPESAPVQTLAKAVLGLPAKYRGRAAEALYEIGLPLTVTAARAAFAQLALASPSVWRYAKSAIKRAMLRGDFATLGWLAHEIEILARDESGTTAKVKSGRDGVTRETKIFYPKTQRYVRRSVWRQLRFWARYRPHDYTKAAAEVLVHYEAKDAAPAKGKYGEYAHCYLLNRVLWGSSKRLEYKDRTLKWSVKSSHVTSPPDGAREESFANLWDAHPLPYLRLLSAAQLLEVQIFAARAVALRHPELMKEATADELLGMLGQTHPQTVGLAAEELETRYDPEDPDWNLLDKLLRDERDRVRRAGHAWLERGAPLWTRDTTRSLAWLTIADSETRERVADQLVKALPGHSSAVRAALAGALLGLLRGKEEPEGLHAPAARVATDALSSELASLLDVAALNELIEHGSPSAKSVAGALLGRRPDALAALGLGRVLDLAQHETIAVRGAAHRLVRSAVADLKTEPGLIFLLVESDWPDTREVAIALLREHLDLATLGLDGVIGLCDSTRVEVQNLGRELVLRHFKEVDAREVMERLAEHPHPNMRRFALELIEKHLPDGADALSRIGRFFSVVLFDIAPDRAAKKRAIGFLVARGLEDEAQAKVAASLLDEVVRSKTRTDFEQALTALTRLRLSFPAVASRVEVTS